jgi:hypothetical protein
VTCGPVSITGGVPFTIPAGNSITQLMLHDSEFSAGATVRLQRGDDMATEEPSGPRTDGRIAAKRLVVDNLNGQPAETLAATAASLSPEAAGHALAWLTFRYLAMARMHAQALVAASSVSPDLMMQMSAAASQVPGDPGKAATVQQMVRTLVEDELAAEMLAAEGLGDPPA